MIEFSLTEEQKGIVRSVRKVSQEVFKPNAVRWLDGDFPAENIALLAQLGVMGLTVPTQYGGLGMGTLEAALVLEEISKACFSTALVMLGEIGVQGRIIDTFAPPHIKEPYLRRLIAGKLILAICITEPDAGSDAGRMRTNASTEGGRLILNGAKTLISRAEVSDVFVVFTRIDGAPGSAGVGCVLVPRDAPGLHVSGRYRTMAGEALSDVRFDNCEVPMDHLILHENGIKKLFNAFNMQRCLNASMCLGAAEGAFDESIQYMRDRQVQGHPISEFQGLRWKLVDMYKEIEAARGLLYRACVSGDPFPDPAQAALAKIVCNEMALKVTADGVQMHGGYGYTNEYAVSRLFRGARAGGLGGGTPDVLRNIVAKHLFDTVTPDDGILSLDTFF